MHKTRSLLRILLDLSEQKDADLATALNIGISSLSLHASGKRRRKSVLLALSAYFSKLLAPLVVDSDLLQTEINAREVVALAMQLRKNRLSKGVA